MKTPFVLIFLWCMISIHPLYSQVVKGKVTDKSGEPVPNASLYIREIMQGIMADDLGEFQITIKEGTYTFEFSSLGYERLLIPVVVNKKPVALQVELEKKTYSLPEVVVSSKREDPAYAVMRKAIAMAPFYLHQIKRYESEVYLKGTMKVEKIPGIMKIQTGGGQSLKDMQNKLFLIESQNQVIFTAPNNYEQHVVAATSNLPAEMDVTDALDVITTNIYDPEAMGRISPLSTQAFSYYKFALEGLTFEGNHMINKIRVTPKKKNPKLVTGWLYIIENSWNVQSADLAATEFGVTIRFTASYNEIKPDAFLPTAYDMDLKIDVMGVKATGKYYSSVQYKEVEINEEQGVIRRKNAPIQPTVPEKVLTPKQQKIQQKMDRLVAKEELSNRDAYKMAKLMEEITEPEERKREKESLELLPGNTSVKLTVDSLARTRDSVYWEEVRALPLRLEERESFKSIDSLKLTNDQGERVITASIGSGSSGDWLSGKQYPIGKKGYFRFNGLLGAVPEYNFVDGFWLGQRFTMGMNQKKMGFSLSPSIYYTTAREAINWQVDGHLHYAPFRNGNLTISGGNTSTDFSKEGELRLLNSLSSLVFGENPIRFYQKRYIEMANRIDIANGLVFSTGFSVEDRNALRNRTSYHFFGGAPAPNIPTDQLIPMEDNRTTKYMLHLEYTPRHYYHLQGGRKRYAHSKYPTFGLGYVRGISNRYTNYHLVETHIRQQIELNPFDYLHYAVSAGTFMDGHPGALPDFKHFRTSELFITGNALENSFSLLNNYQLSTNKRWLEAHLTYSTAYLLIKHIPFLQNYMFNESLHARTLWIPGKNHTELGYSIGIRNIGGIGIFTAFENGKYDSVGFTIAIPILREMGVR